MFNLTSTVSPRSLPLRNQIPTLISDIQVHHVDFHLAFSRGAGVCVCPNMLLVTLTCGAHYGIENDFTPIPTKSLRI